MSARLLFVCTGNYYRSRYAEIRFERGARAVSLPWEACSRGLAPGPHNPGWISPHVLARLLLRDEALPAPRAPRALGPGDLEEAALAIVLDEAEHRERFEARFPSPACPVRYWSIPDIDREPPASALPRIEEEVAVLLASLAAP